MPSDGKLSHLQVFGNRLYKLVLFDTPNCNSVFDIPNANPIELPDIVVRYSVVSVDAEISPPGGEHLCFCLMDEHIGSAPVRWSDYTREACLAGDPPGFQSFNGYSLPVATRDNLVSAPAGWPDGSASPRVASELPPISHHHAHLPMLTHADAFCRRIVASCSNPYTGAYIIAARSIVSRCLTLP